MIDRVSVFELEKIDPWDIKPNYETPREIASKYLLPDYWMIGDELKVDLIGVPLRDKNNNKKLDGILIFDENSSQKPLGNKSLYEMLPLKDNLLDKYPLPRWGDTRKGIEESTRKYLKNELGNFGEDIITLHKAGGNFCAQRNKILDGIRREWYITQKVTSKEDFLKKEVRQVA